MRKSRVAVLPISDCQCRSRRVNGIIISALTALVGKYCALNDGLISASRYKSVVNEKEFGACVFFSLVLTML